MRAAYREGIGCVILAPDQTFEDIDGLPIQSLSPLGGDPASIPWPDGDQLSAEDLPGGVDLGALEAASDWAFHRESPEQVTLSLLVVHKGEIIHERYAPGFDMTTKTRTWSTAKSIAVTLFGILADRTASYEHACFNRHARFVNCVCYGLDIYDHRSRGAVGADSQLVVGNLPTETLDCLSLPWASTR